MKSGSYNIAARTTGHHPSAHEYEALLLTYAWQPTERIFLGGRTYVGGRDPMS